MYWVRKIWIIAIITMAVIGVEDTSASPTAFSLLAPANYSVDVDVYPLFDWEDANIEEGYYVLRYGTDPNFTSGSYIDEDSVKQSQFSPSLDLLKNTIYYWKVKAVDDAGDTLWSNEYFGFQTIDTLAELIDIIPYNRTLRPENSPYIVIGDIFIKQNNWLTIQPGVKLQFDGEYSLKIGGKLVSQGIHTDSISFDRTVSFTGRWKGIEFTGTADDAVFQNETTFVSGSILEYNKISRTKESPAINAGSKNICLRHNLIEYNSWGTSSVATSSVICGNNSVLIDNTIRNNGSIGVLGGRYFKNNNIWGNDYGICTSCSTAKFIHNIIQDNDSAGIKGGRYFEDNILRNNNIGISVSGISNVVIKGDSIINNKFQGIYLDKCSDAIIESCFVDSNGSAGIFIPNYCRHTIKDNKVLRNAGGGIRYTGYKSSICGNTIQYNSSTEGAGILAAGTRDSITGNIITNNTAFLNGGGIYSTGGVLKDNVISSNSARKGGGIYGGQVIKHNTITNNTAIYKGGAIYGNGEVTQNIINRNIAGVNGAGGIYGDPTVLTQNNLYGNESFELRKTDDKDLTGTYNWWGTRSDQVMIEQEIWHAEDTNDSLGRVTYQPFLTSPSTQTPGQLTDITSVSLKSDSTYAQDLPNGVPMGGVLYIQLDAIDGNKYSRDLTAVWVKNLRTSHQIEPLIEETTDSSGIFRGVANVDSNTNFVTNTIGALDGDTIKVMSKVDPSKFILCWVCEIDTISPAEPESLFANDSSSWTNDSIFTISYVESDSSTKSSEFGVQSLEIESKELSPGIYHLKTDKGDTSGIASALYKLGASPSSNYDTTGTADTNPFNVVCTIEGGETLWVWLKDNAGNVDCNNRSYVILNYDISFPVIDSTTVLKDTVNFWGPFEVKAKITDNAPFNNPILFYRTSVDTEWVADTMISIGVSWFADSIPELPHDSLIVDYYLTVEDSATNKTTSGLYSFLLRLEVDIDEKEILIPKVFSLSQNYPNPFIGSTEIEYGLPKDANVNISIYNILGQKVVTLVDEDKNAGYHTVRWNGKDKSGKKLASGVYFYRLKASDYIVTKKMYLIK